MIAGLSLTSNLQKGITHKKGIKHSAARNPSQEGRQFHLFGPSKTFRRDATSMAFPWQRRGTTVPRMCILVEGVGVGKHPGVIGFALERENRVSSVFFPGRFC